MRTSLISLLFAAANVFGHGVAAAPAHPEHEIRQSHERVITTGVQGSGIQPRLEIHQLMERPRQWSLYIQAMRRYMDRGNDDPLGKSYYAISGIHGVPGASWGGLRECDKCASGRPSAYGYCTHLSIQFPGWHRAYTALFEQILVENAIEVANEYPAASRARMVDAAKRLRIPYSDWAAKPHKSDGHSFPQIFINPKITVDGPKGSVTLDNPLYSYHFANPTNGNAKAFTFFPNWPNTLRWPTTDKPDAQSQQQKAVDYMQSLQKSLQEMIFNLLSNCPDYQSFSNSNGGSRQCANSLESIHNSIHFAVGGAGPNGSNGHMAALPFSAFEPFFMVHHCMVDRIVALWQALNPGAWGAKQPIGFPTWTYSLGAVQDANSDMTPFFKDGSGAFWNLNDVRDWKRFNYQYPEFLATDGSRQAISSLVSALYGPNAHLTAGSIPVPDNRSPSPRPASPTRSPPVNPSLPSNDTSADQPGGDEQGTNPTTATNAAPTQSVVPPAPVSNSSETAPVPATGPADTPIPSTPAPVPAPMPASGPADNSSTATPDGRPSWLLPGMDIPGLTDWLSQHDDKVGQIQEQYVANIVSDASALGGRYTVYVFKDSPTEQSDSFWHDQNLVGSVVMMSHTSTNTGFQTYGAVPLSFFLQRMVNEGQLKSTEDSVVLPWLKDHLQWRIVDDDGTVVAPEKVEGFSLSIYSSRSQILAPGGLPHWEPVKPQLDVTKGLPGGASVEPPFVSQILHGLLGQPGGGADSIGAEIAQVVGATAKNVNNAASGVANALPGGASGGLLPNVVPQRPATGQAPAPV